MYEPGLGYLILPQPSLLTLNPNDLITYLISVFGKKSVFSKRWQSLQREWASH